MDVLLFQFNSTFDRLLASSCRCKMPCFTVCQLEKFVSQPPISTRKTDGLVPKCPGPQLASDNNSHNRGGAWEDSIKIRHCLFKQAGPSQNTKERDQFKWAWVFLPSLGLNSLMLATICLARPSERSDTPQER